MKIILQIILTLLLITNLSFGETATNFTGNDCSGNSLDFFADLDAGKVIVIAWVMPCGSCIGGAKTAYNAAQSFSSSHPGRVLYYLSDDYANTSCSTMNSWASTNSMSNATTVSNAALDMNDYGTPGMPKVVVLGGGNHAVYLNKNSGVTNTNVSDAINSALSATGINDRFGIDFQLNVFPNPVTDKLSVSYSITQSDNVKLEVINMVGEKVKEITNGKQAEGQNSSFISTAGLSNGIYFLKVTSNDFSQLVKFTVSH